MLKCCRHLILRGEEEDAQIFTIKYGEKQQSFLSVKLCLENYRKY